MSIEDRLFGGEYDNRPEAASESSDTVRECESDVGLSGYRRGGEEREAVGMVDRVRLSRKGGGRRRAREA